MRNLAIGARRLDYDMEVAPVVYSRADHPFVERLRRDGTPVHLVVARPRHYLQEVQRLVAVLQRTGADLVHTHVYHANFVGFWAARKLGLPVVATIHGFTGGDRKNRLYEWLDLRFLRWFDRVTCVSEPIRHRVLKAGSSPERVAVIPNGIMPVPLLDRAAARTVLGADRAGPLVGWIGRLSREKGPDLLVEAIARLPHPRPSVVLIGAGVERERVEQLIMTNRLDDGSVRLFGERENAASLLAGFDVLVLSSRAEGTPVVLLEAMAARIPVVTFAVGGIPRVLDPTSGWLVEPQDIGALSAAIREAVSDPGEAARRAAAAHRTFEDRFTAENAVTALSKVYDAVFGEPIKRRGGR